MENFSNLSTNKSDSEQLPKETDTLAASGDRVEIMLPGYNRRTGIVLNVRETLGFGLTCSVKIDGASETVRLPCFRLKVVERHGDIAPVERKVARMI